jgi:DNA-binding response OmpR family regulator
MGRMRILVIEDDPQMLELLRKGLDECGHTVTTAVDGETGLEIVNTQEFDAVVLDVGLPGRCGFSVVESLRHRPSRPAILMLTALNKEDNIVYGLDAGADDYLTKPFSFPELVARIATAVRRTRVATTDQFTFGPFHLNISKRRLFCDRSEVNISRSEYLLLRALAMRRGEMVPRRQLLQAVWGTTVISHGALDTLVNSLREKLNAVHPGLIATVRDGGYALVEDVSPRTGKASAS